MLEQYLRSLEQQPVAYDLEDRLNKTAETFDNLLNFLGDSDDFPNEKINDLVTLMGELIVKKVIPVAVDFTGIASKVVFFNINSQGQTDPCIFLPHNYIELVKKAPEVEIGAFVRIASQCRDFFCHKINITNNSEVCERAEAYEAEALQTLLTLAEQERISIGLFPYQKGLLAQFPNGVADLDPELDYDTPPFSFYRWGDPRLN